MSNMSYCRFNNTLIDLQDCKDALDDYEEKTHDRIRMKAIGEEIASLNRDPDTTQEILDQIDELQEELDGLEDDAMSESERQKASALILLCKEITEEFDADDFYN